MAGIPMGRKWQFEGLPRLWRVGNSRANLVGKTKLHSLHWDHSLIGTLTQINDVTEGLEYLHSQKPPIYHGDLKSVGQRGIYPQHNC